MDRYPPIAEHGLIGDLQTAALVATDGTIDFFCCPRFDSPTVFASLLDVGETREPVFAPAKRARPCMLVREVLPGSAAFAVVLANCSP